MVSQSVSVSLGANPAGFIAGMTRAGAAAEGLEAKTVALSGKLKGLGAAFAGYELVKGLVDATKAAGDFQQKTNVLVTAAGESASALKMVRKGILDIASSTGTTWQQVTDGVYMLEKAGYRGADALQVTKVAAQGAKEEGAQLSTVTQALTSVMASYHLKAGDAVATMNQMKVAAGESKTTMEAFSGSLSTVLPLASANKISFADIAGSLASLTQHGTSADEAAQELANTMRGLSAPNGVAIKEMQQLGISSQDVSLKMGDGPGGRGLAGTLSYLSETVLKKMGPSGTVLLDTFNKSKAAAAAAAQELAAMPPKVQELAKQYAAGSITLGDYRKALKELPTDQAQLAKQFVATEDNARGFNSALKNGLPGSQTYTDAIKKMTGGANGLNTTLQLTGESTAGTTDRIKKIADAAQGAGKDVSGWAITQKNFNTRMDEAKQSFARVAIELGTKLLPVASKVADWAAGFADTLGKYPNIIAGVTLALVGTGGLMLAWKAVNIVTGAYSALAASSIGWRQRQTAAMLEEAAAARAAMGSVGGLNAVEAGGIGRVGLLGRAGRGLAAAPTAIGLAATGAEGAVAGSAAAVASVYIVGAAAVVGTAIGITWLGTKLSESINGKNITGDTSNAMRTVKPEIDNGNNSYVSSDGKPVQFGGGKSGMGVGNAVSASSNQGLGIKGLNDDSAALSVLTAQVDGTSKAIRGLDNDSARMSATEAKAEAATNKLSHAHSGLYANSLTASAATGALTKHIGAIAQGLSHAKDKLSGFTSGLALLSDNAITASRAQDGFQQQINNLSSSIDKGSKTLAGNSNAAIQNRGLLDELATANNQHAAAVLKQTGNVEAAKKALHDNAVELEKNAVASFGSKKAADKFLESIGAMPAQVSAAFDGMYAKGTKAGDDLAAGFANGIKEKQALAFANASQMASQTAETLRYKLQTKSPSKVTHKIGEDTATGFAAGIKSKSSHAASEAKKLATAAAAALRHEIKTGFTLAVRELDASLAKLKKSMSKYQSDLSSVRSNRAQAGAGAKGVFTATGDLSQITGATTNNWDGTTSTSAITAAGLNKGLTSMLAKDRTFIADLQKLKKFGLKQSTLISILNMGPEAGGAYAQAILSGGAAEVKTINSLETAIGQVGNQAAQLAEAPYNKQIGNLTTEIQKLQKVVAAETKQRNEAKAATLNITAGMTEAQLNAALKEFERKTGVQIHLHNTVGAH